MSRRLVWILAACALAAAIFVVSVVLSDPAGSEDRSIAGPQDPQDLPGGFDESQAIRFPTRKPKAVGSVEGYRFEKVNDRGQLIQLLGQRLTPQPDGLAEVELPKARFHLIQGRRVVQIQADRGAIVAPNNQPRSGRLEGNVQVLLFDSRGDHEVSLAADSPDLVVRLELEEARFDLDLNQIDSDKSVRLRGQRVQFEGQGLHLTYNELRGQVKNLVIKHGKFLTFYPAAGSSLAPRSRGPDAADAGSAAGEGKTRTPQYYRARFQEGVQVRSKDLNLDGDDLEAVFNLASAAREDSAPASATAPASPDHAPAAAPAAPAGPAVTITWVGPLTFTPEEEAPAELAGPEDFLVALTGRPARAETPGGDVSRSASLRYQGGSQKLTMAGTEQFPVLISSAAMGVLQARALEIDQVTGTGVITGPGSLRTHGEPGLLDRMDQRVLTPERLSRPPRGFSVQWQKNLDLTFYQQTEGRSAQDSGAALRLSGIREVQFHGQTQVRHPQFDLDAEDLQVVLDDPSRGKQTLRNVHAAGNVALHSLGSQNQPPADVLCEQLSVEMTPGSDGKSHPSRLHASGNVDARQAGRLLQTQKLDVELEPEPSSARVARSAPAAVAPAATAASATTQDDKNKTDDDLRMHVRTLTATGGVNIKIDEQELQIRARDLIADAVADQLELFSPAAPALPALAAGKPASRTLDLPAPGEPAVLIRGDGRLQGRHIVIGSRKEKVFVEGPGIFTFLNRPSARPDTRPANAPGKSATKVTVTWNDAMTFDNTSTFAHFVGNVAAWAQTDRESSRLTTDDLRFDFIGALRDINRGARAGSADANALQAGTQAIREVKAIGNVVFLSESFVDRLGGAPETRVRIAGPNLNFDGVTEQFQVDGAGTMLIEDYRRSSRSSAAPNSAAGIQFAGGGTTVFTWQRQLQLDARHNDMLIQEQVRMLHRSGDGKPPTQLDCRRLLADLEANGGLGVWLSNRSVQPKLIAAYADDSVRIVSGKNTVLTDHLEYSGPEQILSLWGRPNHYTTVFSEDSPNGLKAERVRWDLVKNRLEILHMGAGRVPVRK